MRGVIARHCLGEGRKGPIRVAIEIAAVALLLCPLEELQHDLRAGCAHGTLVSARAGHPDRRNAVRHPKVGAVENGTGFGILVGLQKPVESSYRSEEHTSEL